jgi:hypothetical protein
MNKMTDKEKIIQLEFALKMALEFSNKFVEKVHSGRAKSVETYDDCITLIAECKRIGIEYE